MRSGWVAVMMLDADCNRKRHVMLTITHLTALTRHKPSPARIRPRRLSGTRIGPLALCIAVLGLLVVVPGAAAAAGVDITTVEGQSFSGNVVGGLVCTLNGATVTWGDGTPDSAGASDGSTGIEGSHTYAQAGIYSGSVSYSYGASVHSCPVGPQTASFQATVQDAPLSAAGVDVSGTAGQSLSAVVAHINDTNPNASASDFSAQITWGDGSTSPGSLSAAGGGGFDVTGTHTYTTAGNYPVNTSIADVGGGSTTATSTAQIAAPPPPPPPPSPPPPAGPTTPHAQFTVSPLEPCRNDTVTFDASGSLGGQAHQALPRATITQYRWILSDPSSVLAGNAPAPTVVTTTPTLTRSFNYSYFTIGPFTDYGVPPDSIPPPDASGFVEWFDYRFFRPPVTMTLRIVDSAHGSAATAHKITFANSDETWGAHVPSGENFAGTAYGPDFFNFDAVSFRTLSGFKPCHAHFAVPHIGVKSVKPGQASLAASRAVFVNPSGVIAVRSPCYRALGDCIGELEVLIPTAKTRGARLARAKVIRNLLGRISFYVPAHRTATVMIHLGSRGRALVRAHKLSAVTLRLRTLGTNGRLVTTIRTVRLRAGR